MSTQRELVCKNSYEILSRSKVGKNTEKLVIEVTEPKRHFFSRQKKSIITVTKPIKGGPGWRDRVYFTGSYDMLDDILMWMVIYYPVISEMFDFNSDASATEMAEITDSSPEKDLEVYAMDAAPERIIDVEPIRSESHHETYHHHDIGDSHVSHDSDSYSYDSGSGGDSGGGGGCD